MMEFEQEKERVKDFYRDILEGMFPVQLSVADAFNEMTGTFDMNGIGSRKLILALQEQQDAYLALRDKHSEFLESLAIRSPKCQNQ